jgi:hypothetical protein
MRVRLGEQTTPPVYTGGVSPHVKHWSTMSKSAGRGDGTMGPLSRTENLEGVRERRAALMGIGR